MSEIKKIVTAANRLFSTKSPDFYAEVTEHGKHSL
jgi:hypothetical protein